MTIRSLAAVPTADRAPLRAVPVGACADGESRGRVPDGPPASGAAGLASRAIDAWRRLLARRRLARDARSLASLDARTLRDLGVEPDHAARAARGSPPWR